MELAQIELTSWSDRDAHGAELARPVLLQHFPPGWRAISTAITGGGVGPADWWLNAQVSRFYDRSDPARHLGEIAAELGLTGAGVGMLTAAEVDHPARAESDGALTLATVGLGLPVPAAAPDEVVWEDGAPDAAPRPGTINVLVMLPVPLSDAALVNAVLTATEAKTQALVEAGVPGTGTSSDAVCIACPAPGGDGEASQVEPYGGPRSRWGARLARAVHQAVAEGTLDWTTRHPPGDGHRFWGEHWPPRPGV